MFKKFSSFDWVQIFGFPILYFLVADSWSKALISSILIISIFLITKKKEQKPNSDKQG